MDTNLYVAQLQEICAALQAVHFEYGRIMLLENTQKHRTDHSLVQFVLLDRQQKVFPEVFTIRVGLPESFKAVEVTSDINILALSLTVTSLKYSIFQSSKLSLGGSRITAMPANDDYPDVLNYWLEWPVNLKTNELSAIISVPITDAVMSDIFHENRVLAFLKFLEERLPQSGLSITQDQLRRIGMILYASFTGKSFANMDDRPFGLSEDAELTILVSPSRKCNFLFWSSREANGKYGLLSDEIWKQFRLHITPELLEIKF